MDAQEMHEYGYPEPKSRKSLLIIIFGVIVIGVFLVVYFMIASIAQRNVSENKLIEGTSLELKANNTVKLDVGDEESHSMVVNFVGLDSVDLTIQSDPILLNLKIGEIKEVDIDKDGNSDLKVKLVRIKDGKAEIAIKRIGQNICREAWVCDEWTECKRGKQERFCEDINNCATEFDKPLEKRECLEIVMTENESAFDENRRGNESGNTTRNETRERTNNTAEDFENETETSNESASENINETDSIIDLYNNTNETNNITEEENNSASIIGYAIDCGTFYFPANNQDYSAIDCFIEHAKECVPSKVLYSKTDTTSSNLATEKIITLKEIKGFVNNKCKYYQKNVEVNFDYNDETKRDLIEEGYTLAQISELEREKEESILSMNDTCLFHAEEIVKILNHEKEGLFSTADWVNGDCDYGTWISDKTLY